MDISTQDVLNAYRCGFFPMADSRDSEEFYWYDPPMRGQLSVENLHIPAKLHKTFLKHPYDITVNQDFEAVIDGCAARADDREETWINQGIRDLFVQLHKEGHAHSVESRKDGELMGGLYGLAIGGAFMDISFLDNNQQTIDFEIIKQYMNKKSNNHIYTLTYC